MKYGIFTVALALASLPTSALAEAVTAKDPQSVVATLHAAGFTAKLEKDDGGDPLIRSASSGNSFQTFFYGCKANKDCATVQFHAAYEVKKPLTLEKVNEWNRTQRFGRAYLSPDGGPHIEMDIDLDDGGMSRELFTDNLEFWTAIMAQFEEHIGF